MGTTRRITQRADPGKGDRTDSRESTAWDYEVQAPMRSVRRYDAGRWFMRAVVGGFSRVHVEGRSNLPSGAYVLCFTHQNWTDPLFVMGFMPGRPQMFFFGPREEEMRVGARNRLMRWAGIAIPFKPGRRGLLAATARARAILAAGRVVALAGEGRIHAGERVVLPIEPGAAYLALRAGVPIVPLAINGNGWLVFRAVVRLRIGAPIYGQSLSPLRPTSYEVEALAGNVGAALRRLVADARDRPRPGALESRLTELFNDWPEGARPDVPGDDPGASTSR
jgi:1-acyl-sn-glycerol-3-phosphate acyltransferase